MASGQCRRPAIFFDFSRFLKKKSFFEKLVKIGFLSRFGPIWIPNSKTAWKTCLIHGLKSLFHHFLKSDILKIPVLGYFFTFERYFEAWEHQNRTQHEKIPIRSGPETFWPDRKECSLVSCERSSSGAQPLFVPTNGPGLGSLRGIPEVGSTRPLGLFNRLYVFLHLGIGPIR